MGLFDDVLDAVEGTYKLAQDFTREYTRITVEEKMISAALIAAGQIATMLLLLLVGWLSDWPLWSRLLVSSAFFLLVGFNVLKLVFKDVPEAFGFMSSWKKTWLDLMGINLLAIILIENAGLFLFWMILIGSRTLLNWNIDVFDPWAELFGMATDTSSDISSQPNSNG